MAREKKAALRVAQEIVRFIYQEGLRPGDRYFPEAEALVRHGASRGTFREALRFLEMLKVVRVRIGPGGGAIVDRPDWPSLSSTFALLLQFAEAPLGAVLEARRALEPSMAALVADQVMETELAAMAGMVDAAERHIGDFAIFGRHYRAFWHALAEATRNPVMSMLWPALRALVDSGGFVPDEIYRRTLIDRLRTIIAALDRRDAAAVRDQVAALDAEFGERLLARYPQRMARRIAWADVEHPP